MGRVDILGLLARTASTCTGQGQVGTDQPLTLIKKIAIVYGCCFLYELLHGRYKFSDEYKCYVFLKVLKFQEFMIHVKI